ncbi:MAG: SMI1/KNR4 family protein [Kofleriaceae bacterium]
MARAKRSTKTTKKPTKPAAKKRAPAKAKPKAKPKKAAPKPKAKPIKPTRAQTKAAARKLPSERAKTKEILARGTMPISIEDLTDIQSAIDSELARLDAEAIPVEVPDEVFSPSGRKKLAREWSSRSSPVVEILDDRHPIGALRRFLDSIKGEATPQQAEIALGAAQLLLLPLAREARGGGDVKELIDLVLERWADFGERRFGFHAQEFLRNALAAVGVDRDRIAKLEAAVPREASSELLFELACAHAVARDKVALLRAVEDALAAGTSPAQFRREADFAPYTNDPTLAVVLARADIPAIPVDVEPYRDPVRRALDGLSLAAKELGGQIELHPPARLDSILDAERAAKVQLPNDYRAFLSITNGMKLLDREFLSTADYRDATSLAQRAYHFVHADYAASGLVDCVPLANWGQPDDWLLYDPRGRLRGGEPGYVATVGADEIILDDLASALGWLEELTRDILGTN